MGNRRSSPKLSEEQKLMFEKLVNDAKNESNEAMMKNFKEKIARDRYMSIRRERNKKTSKSRRRRADKNFGKSRRKSHK